jgi:CHASE1-domain containing sensor protein
VVGVIYVGDHGLRRPSSVVAVLPYLVALLFLMTAAYFAERAKWRRNRQRVEDASEDSESAKFP